MPQELLGLRDRRLGTLMPDQAPARPPARGFVGLLAGSESAFEEVPALCPH